MYSINKFGRNYKVGVSLSEDYRHQVIELSHNNNSYREISSRLRIQPSTVSKIIKRYRDTGQTTSLPRDHIRTESKLSYNDSLLLETIVANKGSTSLREMQEQLNEYGNCGQISLNTISRNVRCNLPSGLKYSRKRLGKCVDQRFTNENLIYTQIYLDYISTKNPAAIKFFDESGFQLPNSGHRNYGYSEVGKPCLDIRRYNSTANKTLNFLVGIDGLKYANIIDGACDTLEFLRGFSDALRTIDPQTERPVIEVGDVIVIDNCPTHHGEGERFLRETLSEIGVELLFLPVYSPDFNPVEEVFSKLKYLLKYTCQDIVFQNLEFAIWCAVGDITAADTYGYYRHTHYFNM
ncbi:Ankyrin repeat domain-containing 34B [Paramuricea clavata]|uniref:Ankyrin repeat domain-containing 34B n=1 Tax=Paramuricea clavata TaxID=317549 RepID=A0A6S7H322_PARCT|nr:Ankyrin repeat domain-containing 34B [Paramuricea clavata]